MSDKDADDDVEMLDYALECSIKYQDMIKKQQETRLKSYNKYKDTKEYKQRSVINTREYYARNPVKRQILDRARYYRAKRKPDPNLFEPISILPVDILFEPDQECSESVKSD